MLLIQPGQASPNQSQQNVNMHHAIAEDDADDFEQEAAMVN